MKIKQAIAVASVKGNTSQFTCLHNLKITTSSTDSAKAPNNQASIIGSKNNCPETFLICALWSINLLNADWKSATEAYPEYWKYLSDKYPILSAVIVPFQTIPSTGPI